MSSGNRPHEEPIQHRIYTEPVCCNFSISDTMHIQVAETILFRYGCQVPARSDLTAEVLQDEADSSCLFAEAQLVRYVHDG